MGTSNSSISKLRVRLGTLMFVGMVILPGTLAAQRAEAPGVGHPKGNTSSYLLLSGSEQMEQRVTSERPAAGLIRNWTENYLAWVDAAGHIVQAPRAGEASKLVASGHYRELGSREAAGSALERAPYVLFATAEQAQATVEALGLGMHTQSSSVEQVTAVRVGTTVGQKHSSKQEGVAHTGNPDVDNPINDTERQIKDAPGQVLRDAADRAKWKIQGGVSNNQNKASNKVGDEVDKVLNKIKIPGMSR